MDKVYDFLHCANLTCIDDLSTQKRHSISQSLRTTSVLHERHSLMSLNRRGFPVSGLTGHLPRSGLCFEENCRLCPFSVCCGSDFGEITDNGINGSLLDTLVPKLRKLIKN